MLGDAEMLNVSSSNFQLPPFDVSVLAVCFRILGISSSHDDRQMKDE